MRITLLAAACGLACITPLRAEEIPLLQPVVVTASRFSETDPALPAHISVISRDEIRAAPALNLPDLLRSRAGIQVSSLYGQMATNSSVDLRGFGDSATSNTLILLNGQRLNPIDGGGIVWSAIPLASIERIEIVRGSGSVLYGDRASGGVINIITDASRHPEASLATNFGSHAYAAADATLTGGSGPVHFSLTGHYAETDGWRDNTQAKEAALAGRVGHRAGDTRAYLDFALHDDASGTPSALFSEQYKHDPEMARYPFDHQKREGARLRPGVALRLADNLDFEAELAYVENDYRGYNYTADGVPTFRNQRDGDTWSATPRLRWRHGLGGLHSETVAGLDYYDGGIDAHTWSSYSGRNTQRADQSSAALYLQNVTALLDRLDLTLGARRQRVEQSAADINAGIDDETRRSRTAWEAGLSHRPSPTTRVHAKAGTTFRFANTDELFGFDPITYAPIFRGDLKPQHGRIQELGASWNIDAGGLQTALYRTDLEDEIAYDGASYSNVNLPATRHQGLEIEGHWRWSPAWRGRLAYSHTRATYREGMYQGNDIPSVARDRASLELTWAGGGFGAWSAVYNYTGKQRFSGDSANTLDWLPAYQTVDLRIDWDLRPWQLSLRATNLFNERYAGAAGYSSAWADYYYYPADPRSLFIGARYTFR